MKYLRLVLIVLISISYAKGQNVSINLTIPNKLSLSAVDLWNLNLVNNDNVVYEAFLVGTIKEAKEGLLYHVQSAQFKLEPGVVNYNSDQYQVLGPVTELFRKKGYEEFLLRTNELPSGEYEFCVTLNLVGGQETFTSCTDIETKTITPPFLVSPGDEDTVTEQFPFFIWTPPSPVNNQNLVTYTIEIHEVLGFQKYQSSPQLNNAWYKVEGVNSTLHQYGLSNRELRRGNRYTWFVTAYYKNRFIAKSEIWQFVYWPSEIIGIGNGKKSPGKKKNPPRRTSTYYSLNSVDLPNYYSVNKKDLNFMYSNFLGVNQINYRLLAKDMTIVEEGEMTVNYGQNYLTKDLSELTLREEEIYLLEIITKDKIESLRFIYKPANSK